jgi:hypothetical protein
VRRRDAARGAAHERHRPRHAARSTRRGTACAPACTSRRQRSRSRAATSCPPSPRATCCRPARCSCATACPASDGDLEGFSAGQGQFDSDITAGRYPRAALALASRGRLLAVACDGRADDEAGLTLAELAEALVALGARAALNSRRRRLDVARLRGRPAQRPARGPRRRAGRAADPVSTVIAFTPR